MKSEHHQATLVPALPSSAAVTAERIERAKRTVARMMVKHDMPELIATVRFLDAELEKLRQRKSAMDVAKEILLENEGTRRNKGRNINHVA